jgi:transcriptional regulator with XRE-family HTH domain
MYEKYVKLRDEKGLTDYKVAKATGISKSTFTDWKSGRSNPKLEKLAKIAAVFNVPIEYFVTE